MMNQRRNYSAWHKHSFQPGLTSKHTFGAMTSRMMNNVSTYRELREFQEEKDSSPSLFPRPTLTSSSVIPAVEPARGMQHSFSILQQDILRTLAYFDVFAYPLSGEQIYTYLPRNSVSPPQVEETLNSLVMSGLVQSANGFYFFPDRPASVITERLQNEIRAARMMKRVRRIAFFLRQVPFVRAVFITGSLSKNVAGPSSDADFMIVTAPNRLWITKMFLTAFRRVFLLNSIRYFCLNLFVTEKGFPFLDQNVFNAIEVATTQVLWNRDAYRKFQSANSWIEQFLPNRKRTIHSEESGAHSPLQRIGEMLLSVLPLVSLDLLIMRSARQYWRKKNLHLDEERFNSLFHCTPDISSVWYDDHQTRILNSYRRRLVQFGIERPA